jgi:hypothetical protein
VTDLSRLLLQQSLRSAAYPDTDSHIEAARAKDEEVPREVCERIRRRWLDEEHRQANRMEMDTWHDEGFKEALRRTRLRAVR